MANEYVSSSELKATLALTGMTFADADVAVAIEAASRAIDNLCGRRFFVDASDDVRYYSPRSRDRLAVDDVVSITTLKTDDDGDGTFENTWTANVDYVAEPLNAATETPAQPWRVLCRHPLGSYYFPTLYPRSVELTGKFGWAAAPSEIKQASTIVASQLLQRARSAPFGVVGIGLDQTSAVLIARIDPQVAALTAAYVAAPF